MLDGESSEAAQFHAVSTRHRRGDLAENRVDDVLDIALVQVRILGGDLLDKF